MSNNGNEMGAGIAKAILKPLAIIVGVVLLVALSLFALYFNQMKITYKDACNLVAGIEQVNMHLAIISEQQGAHPMLKQLLLENQTAAVVAKNIRDNAGLPLESEAPKPALGLRPLYPGESPRQG